MKALFLTLSCALAQWRHFQYRRIDGTTSLDDREDAIVDFNRPESEVFIFLLSIRAAGRGLNLQTADTVVVYDPDPNPKNEVRVTERARLSADVLLGFFGLMIGMLSIKAAGLALNLQMADTVGVYDPDPKFKKEVLQTEKGTGFDGGF